MRTTSSGPRANSSQSPVTPSSRRPTSVTRGESTATGGLVGSVVGCVVGAVGDVAGGVTWEKGRRSSRTTTTATTTATSAAATSSQRDRSSGRFGPNATISTGESSADRPSSSRSTTLDTPTEEHRVPRDGHRRCGGGQSTCCRAHLMSAASIARSLSTRRACEPGSSVSAASRCSVPVAALPSSCAYRRAASIVCVASADNSTSPGVETGAGVSKRRRAESCSRAAVRPRRSIAAAPTPACRRPCSR